MIGSIPLKDVLPNFKLNRWAKNAKARIRIEVTKWSVDYRYSMVTALGAIEFWVSDISPMRKEDDVDFDRVTAGIELHWRNPPSHSRDDPPDHPCCTVLGGGAVGPPCWHDGSSTWGQSYVERWRHRRTEVEVLQWLVPLLDRLNEESDES